jgi:hypothetical protein
VRLSTVLAPLCAFAAALAGLLGPTTDEHKQGLESLTWTGWVTILVAAVAFVVTLYQAHEAQKRSEGLQTIAYDELRSAAGHIRTVFLFAACIPAHTMTMRLTDHVSGKEEILGYHTDKEENIKISQGIAKDVRRGNVSLRDENVLKVLEETHYWPPRSIRLDRITLFGTDIRNTLERIKLELDKAKEDIDECIKKYGASLLPYDVVASAAAVSGDPLLAYVRDLEGFAHRWSTLDDTNHIHVRLFRNRGEFLALLQKLDKLSELTSRQSAFKKLFARDSNS